MRSRRPVLRALALAGLSGLASPALPCSPVVISPRDAIQAPGPTLRFERIVLAEVIALRATSRIPQLEQWRAEMRAVAAAQALADEREAERARINASRTRAPHEPPPPPPESRLVEPALILAYQQPVALDLFVLETLFGVHQDRLSVPEGGPCGSVPRVGQQVLVFLRPDGIAHVVQQPSREWALDFDPAYLARVRACAAGRENECRD